MEVLTINQGTVTDEKLQGGLGNDSIYGGAGNDVISGFQDGDFLSGGAGDDFIYGLEGKDILDGGIGNDAYQLSLDSADSEGRDMEGFDYLFITSDDVNLDSVDIENPSSFGTGEITLSKPQAGIIGLEKVNNDLLIDIGKDGVVKAEEDIKINDFFDSTGAVGAGFIEGVNNIFGLEIVDYFTANNDNATAVVYRFFRSDVGSHFYTTDKIEKQFLIDNLPEYAYEGESYKSANVSDISDPLSGAKPVYRFLNVDTGAHLYTIDSREKDFIVNNLDNYAFEGIAYHAYESPQENTIELYRFYQETGGCGFHFYTLSVSEKNYIIDNLPQYQLEGDEGIAFYVQSID